MPSLEPITVSNFINEVKQSLEGSFRDIFIIGEVSNLTRSVTGHYYFSLKDRDSLVQVALFKGDAFRNNIIKEILEGDEVQVLGNVSVYAKRGTFQIIAKRVIKKGRGDLKEQFEVLKNKLSKEGLFDISKKLSIPSFPRKIAVVTAPQAAALQDFLNVYRRRSTWTDVVISPTLVQGQEAPSSIIDALDKIKRFNNEKEKIDVVVLTRGGGSIEDLWAFNDEKLARYLAAYELPVVSAVGHQVDFCLTDFICDKRAETPTAAAELLTEQQFIVNERMHSLKKLLDTSIITKFSENRELVKDLNPKFLLSKVVERFSRVRQRVFELNLDRRAEELIGLTGYTLKLDDCISLLVHAASRRVKDFDYKIKSAKKVLEALNPNNVLSRGYSYCSDSKGVLVRTKDQFVKLPAGEEMKICFHGGKGEVRKV